ncbi:MAG: hypothetical protein C0620_08855 [Desulfuromonas sp.]|nr:MAG: hypothetical protein C0620_08855 [Desulfuromonas sp.]
MAISPSEQQQRWQKIVLSVRKEILSLSADERQWIEHQLSLIENLQLEIHDLFLSAQGQQACLHCQGSCCELGQNHMTLANLLAAIMSDRLPAAHFERTCPFLGDGGCTLEVAIRPYNCITFLCDSIEEALSVEEQNRFYQLEQQLRSLYIAFDRRYIGSSLQGLLIRSQSMAGSLFLARR